MTAPKLTDEEIDASLALDGFDPREKYPEYNHDQMRTAYQSGYDDALAEALARLEASREQMELAILGRTAPRAADAAQAVARDAVRGEPRA